MNTNLGKYFGWKNGFLMRWGYVNLKSKDFSLMTDYNHEKNNTRDGYKAGGVRLQSSIGKLYGQYAFASYNSVMIDQALVGIAGIGPLQYFEVSHNSYDPSIFVGTHWKFGKDINAQFFAGYKHKFDVVGPEEGYGLSTKLVYNKAWAAGALAAMKTRSRKIMRLKSGTTTGSGERSGRRLGHGRVQEREVYAIKYIGQDEAHAGVQVTPDATFAAIKADVLW